MIHCGCELDGAVDSVCLVTAINRRYYCQANELTEESAVLLKTSTSGQLPGKRGASGNLELLVLNDQNISGVGNVERLSDLVVNIRELDLAQNNLNDWKQIAGCLSQMPQLYHCNLSLNPLTSDVPSQPFSSFAAPNESQPLFSLPKMNSLVLNGTQIPWPSLFWMMEVMPNLEELHLSLNDMQKLRVPSGSPTPSRIHVLHVNECNIDSWELLETILNCFPSLEVLVAANNPVKSLALTEPQTHDKCGCLQSLNINRWQLSCWEDIDSLRLFPMLCELRCVRLPLLEPYDEQERRNLLIARLPDISTLNGSPIDPTQREDAERFFIRYYLNAQKKPPRVAELEEIHGRLEPLVSVDFSLCDRVKVMLIFEERKEFREINLQQTVGQFKKSLEGFAGMPSYKFRVFFKDMEASQIREQPVTEELNLSKQTLFSMRPQDGDEFHIQVALQIERIMPLTQARTRNSRSGGSTYSPTKAAKKV